MIKLKKQVTIQHKSECFIDAPNKILLSTKIHRNFYDVCVFFVRFLYDEYEQLIKIYCLLAS